MTKIDLTAKFCKHIIDMIRVWRVPLESAELAIEMALHEVSERKDSLVIERKVRSKLDIDKTDRT